MPANINGYILKNLSGLDLNASGSKVIAANYGIKDPMLPAMMGSCTDGSTQYKVYPFPINSLTLNNGSLWSTSTFRFTAPVAGIYYTSHAGIVGNGSATYGYFSLIVNGAQRYFSYRNDGSNWETNHTEVMVKLAAGDWIAWAMNISPGNDSSTTAGGYRNNHNHEVIWLVG
jgi:hypothetical protein